jgi:hypothetical protein
MTKSKFNSKSNSTKSNSTKSFAKYVESIESLAKSAKYLAKSAKSLARQSEAFAVQVFRGDGTSDDDETDDYDARFLFSDDDETDYERNSYSPPSPKYRPTKEFSDDSDDDSDDEEAEAEAWHKHVKAFCKSHLGKGKKYDTFLKCVKAAMKTYKSKGYSHDNPCEGCGATGEYSQVEPTYCSCN